MTKVELTDEDALLFIEFQKHYEMIGYIIGYMNSIGVSDMKNMNITLDIDNNGIVQHTSFTRHFRK